MGKEPWAWIQYGLVKKREKGKVFRLRLFQECLKNRKNRKAGNCAGLPVFR
jgi:hypothetical protein